MNAVEDIQERLLAPAELLPSEIQNPVVMVDGKPELVLPSDHTYFREYRAVNYHLDRRQVLLCGFGRQQRFRIIL